MTDQEKKYILDLLENLNYGEIIVKKEAGKVVVIKKTESIKLSGASNPGTNE